MRKFARQQGVTLLLAILVLSSILAISFSVATILFVEVRSSGDLLRTEPSYYGAAAVAEQALYNLKRGINTVHSGQCDTSLPNCFSTSVGNTVINSAVTSSIADPVQQDSIPVSPDIVGNQFPAAAKHYLFYDPQNPTGGSGYGKLTLTYLSTGNTNHLKVYLCEFDASGSAGYVTVPCSVPSPADPSKDNYWQPTTGGGQAFAGADIYPLTSFLGCVNGSCTWILDPSMQQELVVFNPNPGGNPIYIQLETFDSTGQPKGIPYFEQTAVDVSSQNSDVGRKIRVMVPNSSGGSGSSVNTTNYAAAINGGVTTASSQYSSSYPIADINDGDRLGNNWANGGTGGGWNDASGPPSWVEADFSGSKSISEIDVYTLANCFGSCVSIDATTPADNYGISDFQVQYDNGGVWQTVSGGSVTGNTFSLAKAYLFFGNHGKNPCKYYCCPGFLEQTCGSGSLLITKIKKFVWYPTQSSDKSKRPADAGRFGTGAHLGW